MQVSTNGILMEYELSGKEGAPVVMMSHSLGCNLALWAFQLEALEPHYRVLRYDTRGHGGSQATEGAYTLEQLGFDAISLLDALGVERVHWVGISMGGMIGQELALNHPDRILSLSLCDTAAILPPEAQPLWQERIEAARAKGLKALVEATLERWFTPAFLAKNSAQVEQIRGQFLATPVAGYIGCSEAIRGLNYLDRLPEIQIPTLIIVGEDDPGTPVAVSEAIQKRIAGSRLVVLPKAAHLSNWEQSQAFNQALLEFLKKF
jgi:3-oxoadipate enol-lactonase